MKKARGEIDGRNRKQRPGKAVTGGAQKKWENKQTEYM